VLELYRRGTISSGKAAELLGMERFDFIKHASRLGIPFFDMTDEEWAAEMDRLKAL
jgi:predicted HTH domain antitoxin